METNKELEHLQTQLREALAAENFFETASGKLLVELFVKNINKLVTDITSDKYRKDLMGYNIALADMTAYKKILRSLQVAANPQRVEKIKEKMENLENE